MTKEPKRPYWELLRDPRWQRKRLEIMERDGFRCVRCDDTTTTLNVHHGYYERGLSPWEYDDRTLWTLCEICHEQVQTEWRDLHFQLAQVHPARAAHAMYSIRELAQDNQPAPGCLPEVDTDTIIKAFYGEFVCAYCEAKMSDTPLNLCYERGHQSRAYRDSIIASCLACMEPHGLVEAPLNPNALGDMRLCHDETISAVADSIELSRSARNTVKAETQEGGAAP